MPSRYKLRLDKQGRLVLPAAARRDVGVEGGGALTLEIGEHDARLSSTRMAVRRIQKRLRQYVPEGVSAADGLIADRRAEARREEAEG
jgi:bifunctional DNA-binding transcriptional regulator/antitoxin component of YhaV-PrlF toxin-antitoxin module